MCEIIIIALLIISVRFRGWKWNSECLIDFCLWRDTQIEFYFKLLFHLPHPHHTQQIPFSRLTGRPVVRVGSSVAIHFFISLSQTSREMTLNILNTLWLSVMACIPVGRHFFCTARDFNYLISFQFVYFVYSVYADNFIWEAANSILFIVSQCVGWYSISDGNTHMIWNNMRWYSRI